MSKPKIRKHGGWWVCSLGRVIGCGNTPSIAYHNWKAQVGL
jgi:hypothetical protein